MKTLFKKMAGSIVMLICVATFAAFAYSHYETSPWTRHGIISSDVVDVAPLVSGMVTGVAISHNAPIKKGQELFRIDSEPYQLSVDLAKAKLDEARDQVLTLEATVSTMRARLDSAQYEYTHAEKSLSRVKRLHGKRIVSEQAYDDSYETFSKAKASLNAATANYNEALARLGSRGEDNVRIRKARVVLAQAELDLRRTVVRSPVNGYAVNVKVNPGDFVSTGKSALSLVDSESLHVVGAFKETQLKNIKPGNQAWITFMSDPDNPVKGVVRNVGTAIDPKEYASGKNLIPSIPAVFDWVRLAQRVPVIIDFTGVPDKQLLVVGTTLSVIIEPDSDNN